MRPRPRSLAPFAAALALVACRGRAPDPREELLRAGVPFTAAALVEAAQRGDLPTVRRFLRAGADVEAPDNLGRTPLVAAVDGGSREVAVALLEAGASLRGCTGSPAPGALSPLFAAAVRGNVELATLLLDRGAEPEQPCSGTTPGDEAARFGRREIVKLLTARGAHVTYDPLREKARELAAKLADADRSLEGAWVARGVVRRALSRDDHPEAVARVAEKRTFLGQLLAVEIGGRPAVLATNLTRFDPGPFTLRVRTVGRVPDRGRELDLLVEEVHHEASRYLRGQLRARRDDAYVEYAASLLPAALERADAAGLARGPDPLREVGRDGLALLLVPALVQAELERVDERSALARSLVPSLRGLVFCEVQRAHPAAPAAWEARLEALRRAAPTSPGAAAAWPACARPACLCDQGGDPPSPAERARVAGALADAAALAATTPPAP
ncbi:MAG: ankyrin repeat domain-containing protein [Anaeromyxobacteraceae bacterium]